MLKKIEYFFLLITVITMIGVFSYASLSSSCGVLLMYVLYLILIILEFLDRKKTTITKDKTYSLIVIATSILTLIIILRSLFDTNIVVNLLEHFSETGFYMVYFRLNAYMIDICLLCTIIYHLTYKFKK